MNIQIFGKLKCFDTKKAERYFKERGIKYQFINLLEKGLSKGEFCSIYQVVGGAEALLDDKCIDKDLFQLLKYLSEEDRKIKIFENQQIMKTPIVRNGKHATIGYQTEIWKNWT